MDKNGVLALSDQSELSNFSLLWNKDSVRSVFAEEGNLFISDRYSLLSSKAEILKKSMSKEVSVEYIKIRKLILDLSTETEATKLTVLDILNQYDSVEEFKKSLRIQTPLENRNEKDLLWDDGESDDQDFIDYQDFIKDMWETSEDLGETSQSTVSTSLSQNKPYSEPEPLLQEINEKLDSLLEKKNTISWMANSPSEDELMKVHNYSYSDGLKNYLQSGKCFEGNGNNLEDHKGISLLPGVMDVLEEGSPVFYEFLSRYFPYVFLEYSKSILDGGK